MIESLTRGEYETLLRQDFATFAMHKGTRVVHQ